MKDEHKSEVVKLTEEIKKQNSLPQTFVRGLIYGIGFLIGSAIIATVIIGFLSQWVENIDWVRDSFIRGAELIPK